MKNEIKNRFDHVVEDTVDYIEKSLALALQYAFMSKGKMVDFYQQGCDHRSFAQTDNNQTSEGLRSAIAHKSFTFLLKTVILNGGSRKMDQDFLLRINGDSLISTFPYFGRVFQPFPGRNILYSIESHQFDYHVTARKKGGLYATIKTKDLPKQRQFILTISPNGTSTLNVISNDLDPNSYNGTIKIQEN